MTKQECLERAARCRHSAQVSQETAALMAQTFGGKDKLTQEALLKADVARDAARLWEKVATWHPSTRARTIREKTLPAYIFGY